MHHSNAALSRRVTLPGLQQRHCDQDASAAALQTRKIQEQWGGATGVTQASDWPVVVFDFQSDEEAAGRLQETSLTLRPSRRPLFHLHAAGRLYRSKTSTTSISICC